jgi:putative endonuclease
MPHYLYILKSLKDHRYYIGETHDVAASLLFHNEGKQRSTKGRVPLVLILSKVYETRKEALAREKQIKSWKGGNSFKKLIEGT